MSIPDLRAIPDLIRFLGYDPQLPSEAADLSRLVRHLRQRQGLSMDALAELLNVEPTTIRAWEQLGHKPRPRLHTRLAKLQPASRRGGIRGYFR